MEYPEEVLAWIGVTLVMIGPAIFLLLLRRWLKRWWVAFLGVILLTPQIAFITVGGVAWLFTYERVVVRGDTSVPDQIGQAVPVYLGSTFTVCGMYGVLFAGTGFVLSLPVVGLWRLAHPVSFRRFTRSTPTVSNAEQSAAPDGDEVS